jgi:lycopene cyclase domain-containing protein
MTYALLSLVFLALATAALALALAVSPDRSALLRRWWRPVLIAAAVVLVLTAVFDNVMVAVGLMTYSAAHTSGATLGLVPIEDFAYPLAALLLLPALWLLTRRRRPGERR